MAALKAGPFRSGRGGVARSRGARTGNGPGPGGEPITQRGVIFEEAGGTREEPRKGWHSRERKRHFQVCENAVVRSRSGLARERIVDEARERIGR